MNEKDKKRKQEIINLDDFDDQDSVMKFLQQSTLKIAEGLTGVLASDKSDWKLSAGRIVQSVITGNLLTQLGREVEEYQEKGKIKEDILETDLNRASLKELLKFIDAEAPDEERFKAMKSIFLTSISADVSEEDEVLAYEFLQIGKQLSSGEILILKANFNLVGGRAYEGATGIVHNSSNRIIWLQNIANQIGHGITSLIETHEDHLEELKLISPKRIKQNTAISGDPVTNYTSTDKYRLTSLGYKFCEFITRYE